MKLVLRKEEINSNGGPGGLEIAVEGFQGDVSVQPVQIYLEYYHRKLRVHVWDGSSEDCVSTIIPKAK
jgi:hypothetical protein